MKKLKNALFVLFVGLAASCSSDSDTPVNNPITGDDYFNYTIDGVEQDITQITAVRSGNMFEVVGTAASGRVVDVQFNKWGDVGDVQTLANDFNIPWRTTYHYFKSNYFTFELVSIDEATKKVKVNFSGKVYDDEYILSDGFSVIEGSFQVTYTDVAPIISGLGVSATVAGQEWHDSDGDITGGWAGEDMTLNASNDTKYTIGIVTNHDDTVVGNYSIGPNETSNKMKLFVYNTETDEEDEYITVSGNMNVTTKTEGLQYTVIEGTFNFIAKNPDTNQTVTITGGSFKQAYETP
ncbi:hypothetical protein AAEO56_15335 [Flavobacterium sp. DGU11]|uniref:Lipoprotein n=1 Tax=Flavobacterium arundinis TaxID=3139143 RepID=A0ABU9HZP3_9FLAO